jgi:hypothetical protein
VTEGPPALKIGISGHRVETTGTKVGQGQVDNESVGRRVPQPFKPLVQKDTK